ncbi:hypothetical protein C0J52_14530 [Blattella germanica]|nr:hypothetical protein C0J52_14530 [Blattella germanica]
MRDVQISTIGPYQAFGILYKAKVESFGEGTQALTLLASVNTSVSCLTGILTNYALTKYSCRQVGIVGSLIFFFGGIWVAFCKSTLELVVPFGIMQGFGIGLMFPASFTTINHYFVRRRTFVTGISQLLIGVGCMGMPPIIEQSLQKYGFFGAQLIVFRKGWLTVVNFMDLRLMLDPVFMNIAVGIAFSFFVDVTATTLLSLIILDLHYSTGETALFLSVFSAADLAGRLCIACIGAIYPHVSSRKLVFTGVLFSLMIRTILVLVKNFVPLVAVVALMGFFRSFIQVPMHLTIAEHAKERFPAAYGLTMVMGGIICLAGGPLIGKMF